MKKIKEEIIEVQDNPIKGIGFKDLTPVWKNQVLYNEQINEMMIITKGKFSNTPHKQKKSSVSYKILKGKMWL